MAETVPDIQRLATTEVVVEPGYDVGQTSH
jgi:hypothetical protein